MGDEKPGDRDYKWVAIQKICGEALRPRQEFIGVHKNLITKIV